jgi:hypothetical protein
MKESPIFIFCGGAMCCVNVDINQLSYKRPYEHVMVTKTGGASLLVGCEPMGLGAVSYALAQN